MYGERLGRRRSPDGYPGTPAGEQLFGDLTKANIISLGSGSTASCASERGLTNPVAASRDAAHARHARRSLRSAVPDGAELPGRYRDMISGAFATQVDSIVKLAEVPDQIQLREHQGGERRALPLEPPNWSLLVRGIPHTDPGRHRHHSRDCELSPRCHIDPEPTSMCSSIRLVQRSIPRRSPPAHRPIWRWLRRPNRGPNPSALSAIS